MWGVMDVYTYLVENYLYMLLAILFSVSFYLVLVFLDKKK